MFIKHTSLKVIMQRCKFKKRDLLEKYGRNVGDRRMRAKNPNLMCEGPEQFFLHINDYLINFSSTLVPSFLLTFFTFLNLVATLYR